MTLVEAWRILDIQLNGRGNAQSGRGLQNFSRALRANPTITKFLYPPL